MGKPFTASTETEILYGALMEFEVNKLVPYQYFKEELGVDVQVDPGRARLRTARLRMLNRHDIYIDAIKGRGLMRIDGAACNHKARGMTKSISNKARLAQKVLRATGDGEMTAAEQITNRAYDAMLGALGSITKPRRVKQLEVHVTDRMTALPVAKTLELFQKNGGTHKTRPDETGLDETSSDLIGSD